MSLDVYSHVMPPDEVAVEQFALLLHPRHWEPNDHSESSP
jgi:hypothetical protein